MIGKVAGAVLAAVVVLIIGAFSVWTGQPWLAPSLASAVFVQTLTPTEPTASVWHSAVGQLAGEAGGFAGVFLTGANLVPSFMASHHLVYARVEAAGIAGVITALLQLVLQALSPAGGATALIVALGAETANLAGAGRLLLGIILVTILGEIARRIVLRLR